MSGGPIEPPDYDAALDYEDPPPWADEFPPRRARRAASGPCRVCGTLITRPDLAASPAVHGSCAGGEAPSLATRAGELLAVLVIFGVAYQALVTL